MASLIQLRRDTPENWTTVNPILSQGEMGLELGTNRIKIVYGVTHWDSLPYSILPPADIDGGEF